MNQLSELSCCPRHSDSIPLRRSRFHISCSTMARFTTIIFLIVVILIVILAIFGESANGQQRSNKSRPKGAFVKKKRVQPTVVTTVSTPIEVTEVTISTEVSTEAPVAVASLGDSDKISFSTEGSEVLTSTPRVAALVGGGKRSGGKRYFPGNGGALSSDDDDQSDEIERKQNKPKIIFTRYGEVGKNGKAFGCEDECDPEECVTPDPTSCPTGLVLDRCGCCKVCGAGDGNRCTDAKLNLPYNPDIGSCGEGLVCKLRSDLEPTDVPEALCECKDSRVVCGTNNVTYTSACKLREAAHTISGLEVASWKPCIAEPWISTPAENVTVALGDEAALSCEVRGYPSPVIHWEFQPRSSSNAAAVVLPGDDSSLVVVVRGGPELMTTTSWIQMVSVTKKREGSYFCIAKNAVGSVHSIAYVAVI